MRRVLAFLLGIAAGLALVELLSRRRRRPGAPPRDPRAEELARKLAETRGPAAPAGRESPPGEPEAGSAVEAEIDAARRRVHDEGRAAVDAMRKSGGAPPAPQP